MDRSQAWPAVCRIALAVPMLMARAEAQGLSKVNSIMQNVLTVLQGVSAIIVAIAVISVGYRMIFHHARWTDVSNIVVGAIFIGSATTIASWLLG